LQNHTELRPRQKEISQGGYTPYNHAPQPNIKYRSFLNNSLRTPQQSTDHIGPSCEITVPVSYSTALIWVDSVTRRPLSSQEENPANTQRVR